MAVPAWDFEKREVDFTLYVRAIFHPSIGAAIVTLPWLDDVRISSGPLSGFTPEGPTVDGAEDAVPIAATGSRMWPGATRAFTSVPIKAAAPVTFELVRQLQRACLPVSVFADGNEAGEAVSGAARIHLGPLLLAGGSQPRGPPSGIRGKGRVSGVEVAATWTETVGLAGLYSLEVSVSTSMPLLSQEMLALLLPACFTVDAIQGLPNDRQHLARPEDVHVEVYPELGSTTRALSEECRATRSAARPPNSFVRFAEPVVWLLGLLPHHLVREWLQHQGLTVAVHDTDVQVDVIATESVADGMDDAEGQRSRIPVAHPHGLAHFDLAPLLESRALFLSLRAEVVPSRGNKKMRRAEMLKAPLATKGLLSEEGRSRLADRTAEDKLERTTEYHKLGTVCTLRAELAVPIPVAPKIQAREEAELEERWAAEEEQDDESNIWIARSPPGEEGQRGTAQAFRAKLQRPEGNEFIVGPWRRSREEAESDEQQLLKGDIEAPKALGKGMHRRFERFGRVVVTFQDGDTSDIQRLLQVVRHKNAQTLGVDPRTAALETYTLSDQQFVDPHLDILTGFVVMDGSCRLVVIEGLRDGGVQDVVEQGVSRGERQNSPSFKLLQNPNVGFTERLYMEFGPSLKTIKIRPELSPLEELASKPELYSFSGKLPEDMVAAMDAPKLLSELKRAERLSSLRLGSAFPSTTSLTNFEILYGGYKTDEEIAGHPVGTGQIDTGAVGLGPRRVVLSATIAPETTVAGELQKALEPGDTTADGWGTAMEKRRRQSGEKPQYWSKTANTWIPARARLSMQNEDFDSTLSLRKSASAPDFKQVNREVVKARSLQNTQVNDIFGKKKVRETPFLDGQEVHIYSQQKFNSVELQKEWMRAAMDPHQKEHLWSYCPAYMSTNFEFAGAQPPGKVGHTARCANDSYARTPGDTRNVWRNPHPRPKEEFRKLDRDLGHARPDELREPFMENEWFQLAVGVGRRMPLSRHVSFDPAKVPHHRVVTEQPFDPARITNEGKEFGPPSLKESVNYHGDGAPGEQRYAENERRHAHDRDREVSKRLQSKPIQTFSQISTRQGVTDLDRREPILKDKSTSSKHFKSDEPPRAAPSIRQLEDYHERGNPTRDFQARMRENDASAPYDAATQLYVIRDPEVGEKRACMSGTLGKAPWRHGGQKDTSVVPTGALPGSKRIQQTVAYSSDRDFDLTRMPPRAKATESQVWKNASRSRITQADRKHAAYRRPVDYGVSIPA